MNSFSLLAILFLAIPILEIYLLISVGSIIGVFPTILLVIATAVIGAFLLRQQGISTFMRFQQNLSSGQLPAKEMLEGVMLLVGGALLMTPGFFTDTIGFLCLIPFTRQWIADFMIQKSIIKVKTASGFGDSPFQQQSTSHQNRGGHGVYEGEFTEKPTKQDHIDYDDR